MLITFLIWKGLNVRRHVINRNRIGNTFCVGWIIGPILVISNNFSISFYGIQKDTVRYWSTSVIKHRCSPRRNFTFGQRIDISTIYFVKILQVVNGQRANKE